MFESSLCSGVNDEIGEEGKDYLQQLNGKSARETLWSKLHVIGTLECWAVAYPHIPATAILKQWEAACDLAFSKPQPPNSKELKEAFESKLNALKASGQYQPAPGHVFRPDGTPTPLDEDGKYTIDLTCTPHFRPGEDSRYPFETLDSESKLDRLGLEGLIERDGYVMPGKVVESERLRVTLIEAAGVYPTGAWFTEDENLQSSLKLAKEIEKVKG